MATRILVADDHLAVGRGVRAMHEFRPDVNGLESWMPTATDLGSR